MNDTENTSPAAKESECRFVGLDLHKRMVEVCILDSSGKIVQRTRIAPTRSYLRTFGENVLRPTDQVALEATTNSWAVARALRPYVASVTVSNAVATKAIAFAKVKTDKVDALVLAQLLRCDYLPSVWLPDEKTQQLREVTSRRTGLVGQRTAVRNRIHSVLATRLIEAGDERLFTAKGLSWLRELEIDAQGRLLLDSDLRLLESIDKEIAALDQVLAERGWEDPRVKLLLTLPGVDVVVALAILAAAGDIHRFCDGDQFAAYLGLVPSTRQSANHCYHGPITKAGRSHTRWMLVQAAHQYRKHPGPLGNFFRKLRKRKNYNVAVVGTARKLAVIAWHLLTRQEPYRYAVPKSTETKLAGLRVRATKQRRKTGPKADARQRATLPAGTRQVKSLAEVYECEGLPPLPPAKPGELRTIVRSESESFVAQIEHSQLERRSPKRRRPKEASAT